MNWQKAFKVWDTVLIPSIAITLMFLAFSEMHYTKWIFIAMFVVSLPSAIYTYVNKKSIRHLIMLILFLVIMIGLIFEQINIDIMILNWFVVGIMIYGLFKLVKRYR